MPVGKGLKKKKIDQFFRKTNGKILRPTKHIVYLYTDQWMKPLERVLYFCPVGSFYMFVEHFHSGTGQWDNPHNLHH